MIVCDRAALGGARVLERSFRTENPGSEADLIVAEEAAGLGIADYGVLSSMYGPPDLARALVPFVLGRALDDRAGAVATLAPDARVLRDLGPVEDALTGAAACLAPRHLQPEAVGPGEPVFDDGFVALAGDEGRRLSAWWAEQVMREGLEGAWLDRLPALSAQVVVLRDPGCAVAPWNLAERPLEQGRDGRLMTGNVPVRWLRLPGLRANGAGVLEGARVSDHPALRELVLTHAADLAEEPPSKRSDPPVQTASGLTLDARLRGLYTRGRREGALTRSLFDPAGAAAFLEWLREPEVGDVSRYLHDVYREAPNLQQIYPDLRSPDDRDGFHGWAIVHGAHEVPIPEVLLPPHPSSLREQDPGMRISPPWGVNVAGYFQSELGVGEAARRVVEALDAAHVPSLPVQGSIVPPSRRGQDFGSVGTTIAPFAVNLICVNADGLPAFARDVGKPFFEHRYNIGHWAWEVTSFPERWKDSFSYLDEIWVHSDFLFEALAAVSPIPVRKFRMPVEVPPPLPLSRSELGLPEGRLFLFMFDYHSVFERKNPLGLIEAYTRAFAPEDGAALVIKCINSGTDPANHERLLMKAAERPDIHVVDRYVASAERDAMLAACDCYVSLHRAEGFGFTLAEAMSLAKPVIATAYSGTLEFMSPDTSWLVPCQLVPIGEGHDPYPAAGEWADPDLDAAAEAMRTVHEDPVAAAERGAHAAAAVREAHSPAAAGRTVTRLLGNVRLEVTTRAKGSDSQAVAEARDLAAPIRERVAAGADSLLPAGAGRFRRMGRRWLLRALKPLSSYQSSVDAAVAEAIEGAVLSAARRGEQARLDQLALYAGTLARARRLHADALVERRELLLAQSRTSELSTALYGLPYLADDPFQFFDMPVAGRVWGFRESPAGEARPQDDYRYFEEVLRGPRERVAGLVSPYLDLLRDDAPVLDFGCGRGEMLELLRDAGIEASGVDSDESMVAEARALGLDVELDDGIAYLERQPDGALGAVFACQVIEHLPYEALTSFFSLSRRKLRDGGLLIAETVNPHALHALKAFWLDPTHQHPLFPEVVLTMSAGAGFGSAYVCHLHGVRDVERDRFNESSFAVVATA